MFHSVSLLSQAPLERGSCALPSVLLIIFLVTCYCTGLIYYLLCVQLQVQQINAISSTVTGVIVALILAAVLVAVIIILVAMR